MQPHSAALIALLVFLKRGGTGSSFTVKVQYNLAFKIYTIRVSMSGTRATLNVSGLWSCSVTVPLDVDKVTLSHQGKDSLAEDVTFYLPHSVKGNTRNSSKYGSFDGHVTSPNITTFTANFGGKSVSYEAKVY